MLCELLDGKWKIGTHTLGCIDGLGGFQLVHWYYPQKYYQHSRNSDLRAVIEPLLQKLRSTHPDGSLLIMSANNDELDHAGSWREQTEPPCNLLHGNQSWAGIC